MRTFLLAGSVAIIIKICTSGSVDTITERPYSTTDRVLSINRGYVSSPRAKALRVGEESRKSYGPIFKLKINGKLISLK
jgi:hypothetical protein